MNDDITFVLGSSLSCDGQTFVSDITSSSRWSSAANLFVSRQTEGYTEMIFFLVLRPNIFHPQ